MLKNSTHFLEYFLFYLLIDSGKFTLFLGESDLDLDLDLDLDPE